MKKIILAILLLVMCFTLCACGSDDEPEHGTGGDLIPKKIVLSVTSTPIPTATPINVLNSTQYVLQWKNDPDRGMNYMIPTHWEETTIGERYHVYSEPVEDGKSGFRVCFANKKKASDPDTAEMRNQFRKLMSEMEGVYEDFKWEGEISREIKFTKFNGYSSEFSYTDDNGEPMKGFAIIATYNRRIYCMTWSGPVSRYVDLEGIMLKIVESVTRVS